MPCELPERPPLVFTDGASEREIHTVGGILIRPGGLPPRFFACHVPASLVESWRKSMKHLIGPTFAAVVARAVWHQFLSGQAYIHFIDMGVNQSHKDNLRHLPRLPGFFVTFRILSVVTFLN